MKYWQRQRMPRPRELTKGSREEHDTPKRKDGR